MNFDLPTIEYVIITICFGAVGGAVSGAFVADYFANRRARQRRKTDLLSFLNVWSSEINANRKIVSPASNVAMSAADRFDEKRLKLIEKATSVELDFRGKNLTTLKNLLRDITVMAPGHIENDEGREIVLGKIEALAEFLRAN